MPDRDGFFQRDGKLYCPGDLAMHRHGKQTVKGIHYVQYRCPFYDGPNRPEELMCPADHPKFTKQKGCNKSIRLDDNPRDQIPYGTVEFKTYYNLRVAVERVFSRLLAITLQKPAVRGLQSVRNHCIISVIGMLLVALAARRLGYPEYIRYARTLVPDILEGTRPEPQSPQNPIL